MSISILENAEVRGLIPSLSLDAYHLLRDSGAYAVNTELVNGVVVEKMTKSPLHTFVLNCLFSLLQEDLPEDFWLRKEDPLSLADSEPEPDISVVAGKPTDFVFQHPSDAELVIEVAVTSVELDQAKAAVYAQAEIPQYWLVLPKLGQVVRFAQPTDGVYREQVKLDGTGKLETSWGKQIDVQSIFAQAR